MDLRPTLVSIERNQTVEREGKSKRREEEEEEEEQEEEEEEGEAKKVWN